MCFFSASIFIKIWLNTPPRPNNPFNKEGRFLNLKVISFLTTSMCLHLDLLPHRHIVKGMAPSQN